MKRIVIASNNEKKIKELKTILNSLGYDPITRKAAGVPDDFEVLEDADTFEGNSYKKALEIMKLTGEITLADDSGLCVDALGGRPGVFSARFSGENASDSENNEKLFTMLEGEDDRRASFICVITLIFPNGQTITASGECKGKISTKKALEGGFGYDPLFIPDGYEKTFAELGSEVKNEISHRALALKEMVKKLKEI